MEIVEVKRDESLYAREYWCKYCNTTFKVIGSYIELAHQTPDCPNCGRFQNLVSTSRIKKVRNK